MTTLDADCVVVGGGIGGAVLALALGRRKLHVLVLERSHTPQQANRPEILARVTMEAFHDLGVGPRILEEATIPLHGIEMWQSGGERLAAIVEEDLQRAGAQPYSTDPAKTRELLLEAALATGHVELQRGVDVQHVRRDDTQGMEVEALHDQQRVSYTTSVVVGDDGGHSRIREALGIPLITQEFPLEFLGTVGPRLPGQSDRVGQAWLNPRGLRDGIFAGVFMPLPAQRTALVFILSAPACGRLQQGSPKVFYEAAKRFAPLCETLEQSGYVFPQGFSRFHRPFGHARSYVRDGAALMGDAVHPVTPAGGQGANMSVADAMVLAEVLVEALHHKDCSVQRLQAYQAVRWAANQRSMQFSVNTNRVVRFFQHVPWIVSALPWYLRRALAQSSTKTRLLRAVGGAFVSQPPLDKTRASR